VTRRSLVRYSKEGYSSMPEDPYLSIKDITEELKVSHETVRKWLLASRLPYVRAGRSYRIRRSELDRMLAGDARPQTPALTSMRVSQRPTCCGQGRRSTSSSTSTHHPSGRRRARARATSPRDRSS
jgi:excisionase family DNA binding protein